jgi:hypothetical protein
MTVQRRFFSHDDTFGVTKYWHYDDDTDTATIETVQDIEPLLEAANRSRIETDGKRWGDGKHVAFIPQTVLAEWYAHGKQLDQDYMRKWLNHSDNRKYRTFTGKV